MSIDISGLVTLSRVFDLGLRQTNCGNHEGIGHEAAEEIRNFVPAGDVAAPSDNLGMQESWP